MISIRRPGHSKDPSAILTSSIPVPSLIAMLQQISTIQATRTSAPSSQATNANIWLAVSIMASGLTTTRTMILRLFTPLTPRLAVTPASLSAVHRPTPRESRMRTSGGRTSCAWSPTGTGRSTCKVVFSSKISKFFTSGTSTIKHPLMRALIPLTYGQAEHSTMPKPTAEAESLIQRSSETITPELRSKLLCLVRSRSPLQMH